MHPIVGKGLQHPSGRVIALGRLMLATLFLLAIWIDASQPARPAATYALLGAYVAFAAAIVVTTWSNWWLDAKLAGPGHAIDIVLFAVLVLLTEGYTSPFFTFFMFLLLSAAIRWGWQATALTAILLTLTYLITGLVVVTSDEVFELQRFVVRTGHLVILSLIMIWFGINQWEARSTSRDEDLLGYASLDEPPLEIGLRAAMNEVRACAGSFVWLENGRATGLAMRDGTLAVVNIQDSAVVGPLASRPFLYDLPTNRALRRDVERNLCAFAPGDAIRAEAALALALRDGIAIPVHSDTGEGVLFLDDVPDLSTDHIDLGEQIATDIAAHFQRHALLEAAEEAAEARSRLTLARDLHDSVVQFLAGAAFRLEAMKRSESSGRDIKPELNELKQLMLLEQGELRTFITALRGGPLVALSDLASDLKTLADRLSRQWDILCDFSARPADLMIPTRLHQDAHQLVREAVANAVRHAGANSVSIALSAAPHEMRLEFTNDGARYPRTDEGLEMPQSLCERVDQAGGALEISRGMGVTKVSISLPLGERRR
ncbi:MAG: sensor histidine kinase [Sphingomicrobium sp.]